MDISDSCRASSGRLSSSNIWKNTAIEVFSRSSCGDDDEEALKWAAIEKLPTYLRIRRGILKEEQGQAREIYIQNLGLLERKHVLERLVKIAEEDHEKFLLKLRDRIERFVHYFSSHCIFVQPMTAKIEITEAYACSKCVYDEGDIFIFFYYR